MKRRQLAKARSKLVSAQENKSHNNLSATNERRRKRCRKLQREVSQCEQELSAEGYQVGGALPSRVLSSRQPATKQISVSRWPRALCIHIRRNHMARKTPVMRVSCPLTLTLTLNPKP